MCNAWNHPVHCRCGWGGEGHLGRRSDDAAVRGGPIRRIIIPGREGSLRYHPPTSYDSFVNPNALCPVCGAAVFFFQSSYGGRVFFDELGPPWPKHPCTDLRDFRLTDRASDRRAASPTRSAPTYYWEDAGYHPFILRSVQG